MVFFVGVIVFIVFADDIVSVIVIHPAVIVVVVAVVAIFVFREVLFGIW